MNPLQQYPLKIVRIKISKNIDWIGFLMFGYFPAITHLMNYSSKTVKSTFPISLTRWKAKSSTTTRNEKEKSHSLDISSILQKKKKTGSYRKYLYIHSQKPIYRVRHTITKIWVMEKYIKILYLSMYVHFSAHDPKPDIAKCIIIRYLPHTYPTTN